MTSTTIFFLPVFGEKIDIIPYSTSIERFIAAALSPAMVTEVVLDDEEKRAEVSVPEDQQSLAIGKEGQNARLANKLTNWKIDIKGAAGIFGTSDDGEKEEEEAEIRGRFVVHDLRRSWAMYCREMGRDPAPLLGHVPSGVTELHYARQTLNGMRETMRVTVNHMLKVATAQPGDVVPFPSAEASS